eukprot:TRINITY_DN47357_c0_g1_i1.p1 TRINITY_DN47357_c0_g1~~TRINITY_DN47357_c0_g1_i1.p1  ORF type:complete len:288 (+),score=68.17 TRINITY_DN47357_c0_g1_i1:112-864(+)
MAANAMSNGAGLAGTGQKIMAFREFASSLAAQVVEQLCIEYEREVNTMYQDLVTYRNELGRVAELLGHQLGREKQLHEMLEAMHIHSHAVASQGHQAAAGAADSKDLHNMVDQIAQQHSNISASMLQGMSQAHTVAQTHAMAARQLQEPLINAENEFNRICKLLEQPMISLAAPQPTAAMLPKISITQQQQVPPLRSSTPPLSPAAAYTGSGGMSPALGGQGGMRPASPVQIGTGPSPMSASPYNQPRYA